MKIIFCLYILGLLPRTYYEFTKLSAYARQLHVLNVAGRCALPVDTQIDTSVSEKHKRIVKTI